ncbi:MAG: GNAT family N-acetyltransferase [Leptolyngbyaceae cyanobacterium SM1_1_3]|nr:GNAT family N-acetyltransferase [Leptolyngbyaceae cyanobacterium SM1_1_3]NJN03127.1 GNAT family N-acetyltransferase [Leptolyngbyaceae cyanobacterium RM1_1_2]NJO09157.1 GNAT family N-acetyltransferase [Leptolyngbyaceae cyanobacterium SL_1_1]
MVAVMGYCLRAGSVSDRPLLVSFMQRTYQEIESEASEHLGQTVERHFSADTPLWWVLPTLDITEAPSQNKPVGCLWLGNAVDQLSGDRHACVLLLYVDPRHRRRGLGTALMQQAIAWAKSRGDRQIGLQVFCHNQAARQLYEKLGFAAQALWMTKPISDSL